jgi:hypothetical protein
VNTTRTRTRPALRRDIELGRARTAEVAARRQRLEPDDVLVLGDDEVEDLAAAAYLVLQANRRRPHPERLDELFAFVRGLRAPLEQMQLDLAEQLRRRSDNVEASSALRVVNDALARTRTPAPTPRDERRRWRR